MIAMPLFLGGPQLQGLQSYWALGHVHQREFLSEKRRTLFFRAICKEGTCGRRAPKDACS